MLRPGVFSAYSFYYLLSIAGPIGAARNVESLLKSGITHVLNASPVIPCFHKRQFRYKKFLIYDDPDDDIARFFDESNKFIHKVCPHMVNRFGLSSAGTRYPKTNRFPLLAGAEEGRGASALLCWPKQICCAYCCLSHIK